MNAPERRSKIWQLVGSYRKMDAASLAISIANHLEFSLCKNRYTVNEFDIYESLALSIRDRLVEYWNDTQQYYHKVNCKRVYYLSLEYLMGRSLRNNLLNLGVYDTCKSVLEDIGYDLNEMEEYEHDAGLGNGGLGRLAACFLDSMATLQLPAQGYGIRYEFGIFNQKIENGQQVEHPDDWLRDGFAWEIPRWDLEYPIHFYGRAHEFTDENGKVRHEWVDTQEVRAVPYDVPIPGFGVRTVNNLRLWDAQSTKDFDFKAFNAGDYLRAVEEKQRSRTISKVLYPNDKGFQGKELRLKQQYFFVSASLQDIIRRYKSHHDTFDQFSAKVAIQLNDTHPSIAVAELMRILVDIEGMEWARSWEITQEVFAYTNHTVLPEALEKWPVELMGHLLPRHLQIIFRINQNFLEEIKEKFPQEQEMLGRISLIEEGWDKQVRMPNLAIVGSHTINGVSALHSELLKETIFKDFYKLFPEKFQNKTNGITPRRWIRGCNPELSALITSKLGSERWVTNLDDLKGLVQYADDAAFQKEWMDIKQLKKQQLADYIKEKNQIDVNLESMFDVQVKRLHEYKRQLLNVLHVITLYNRLRANPGLDVVPRTVMFGAKAAPGYYMAKLVIHLINDIAATVNNDPTIGDKLKVVFLENYGVSLAERIIPATDLSEQISTAGTEASGTGNMKFALNGALTIGTLDGANVEMREEVGAENFYIFGMNTEEVFAMRSKNYKPRDFYNAIPELREAMEMINNGFFNKAQPHLYHDIYNSLMFEDRYLLFADFKSYLECQELVSKEFADKKLWARKSILNAANMGKFSSDRTIAQYAKEIWGVVPIEIPPSDDKLR